MTRFLILLPLLCLSLAAFSQRNLRVSETYTEFKKQRYPSLEIKIDAPHDEIADYLEDFWEERYDIDIDKLDKDKASTAMLAEQVSVPIVSDKNFDLYVKAADAGRSTTVSMAIVYSENDVVSSRKHTTSYSAAEAIMGEFHTFFYTKYFDEQMEDVREELEDIRDDGQDASSDAEKARKKIKKYEEKIAKLQRKIEKEREEVGEELETAEEKDRRARELEDRLRELQRARAKYLG